MADAPDLTHERAARNEALFREVNEAIEGLHQRFESAGKKASFFCECSDKDCLTRIEATLTEYEQVRGNPLHFIVVPGHERLDVEHVVRRLDAYFVVSKDSPVAERIAEGTDPRR